ncbi:hypothetical protein D9M72_590120 [compost metagenome]
MTSTCPIFKPSLASGFFFSSSSKVMPYFFAIEYFVSLGCTSWTIFCPPFLASFFSSFSAFFSAFLSSFLEGLVSCFGVSCCFPGIVKTWPIFSPSFISGFAFSKSATETLYCFANP